MDPVNQLSAMQNQIGTAFIEKQNIQQRFSSFMGDAAYQNIEVPIVENTELFLRKSDGELAPQMYSFRDPVGRQVSLRPEITTQVMNHYLKECLGKTTQRYQYQGPVFRYSDTEDQRTQFTQIGAECIGDSGVSIDVEILQLACAFPEEIGFKSYQCKLADLSLVNYIIDNFGLSTKAKNQIVENIQILKEGSTSISELALRLSASNVTGDTSKDAYLSAAIENLSDAQAVQVLSGFLGWVNGSIEDGSLGRRSHEDVVNRLISKLRNTDTVGKIQECLEIISFLININGTQGKAISEARSLFSDQGYPLELIDAFEGRINGLKERIPGSCEVVIDFGLVRDFGYYTGIIFEIIDLTNSQLIGGGGRYDGLAVLLGSEDCIEALGFAFDLDKVLEIYTGTI